MAQHSWHDCPTDVRAQVEAFVADLNQVLGDALTGVYLHGSLAMDCFNPQRSDVDLLVLASRRLTPAERHHLGRIALRRSRAPQAVEFSVLNARDLRPWRHPAPYELHFSERWRERFAAEVNDATSSLWDDSERTDADLAAHISLARARGIALAGARPAEALPEVPPQDYAASIVGDFRWARERIGRDPLYFVLNACRVLAFLRAGLIASKREGGEWALRSLPPEWHAIVRRALDAYAWEADVASLDPTDVEAFASQASQLIEGASAPRYTDAP